MRLLEFCEENWLPMKKPSTALAGDGLCDDYRSLLRQASYPAPFMELRIRIVGMTAATRWTGKSLAMAAEVRMTLIEVKQSSKG
jgi:hypothetical protein